MVDTVGKKMTKHGEMKWTPKTVKIATSEIHFSILKRNFTITFLHNFLRGITYQNIILYGRIPFNLTYSFLYKKSFLKHAKS